jgi:hypothetical protein
MSIEPIRVSLSMEPYSAHSAARFPLNSNNDWLRKHQKLALPILPPTTPPARRFFFSKIRDYTHQASEANQNSINFIAFAREWNQTADGKVRFYITADLLSTYAKSWERANNIRASQDMIRDKLKILQNTSRIFAGPSIPFPDISGIITQAEQPGQGVREVEQPELPGLPSTSVAVSVSVSLPTPPLFDTQEDWPNGASADLECEPGVETGPTTEFTALGLGPSPAPARKRKHKPTNANSTEVQPRYLFYGCWLVLTTVADLISDVKRQSPHIHFILPLMSVPNRT